MQSADRLRLLRIAATSLAVLIVSPAMALDETAVATFGNASLGEAPAGWKFTTLPNKVPTRFSVVELGGARVLKVEADDSYGNLVHGLHFAVGERSALTWRWRVDKLIDGADLKLRTGDDSPAKLCVFFDFDRAKLPLGERTKLAIARSTAGQDVPAETLCYVWDNKLPVDTVMPNAFTKRVRFIVLQSGSGRLGQWTTQRRDLAADYLRAFADESDGKVPEVVGVAVSADGDNTHGSSVAYFGDITLAP